VTNRQKSNNGRFVGKKKLVLLLDSARSGLCRSGRRSGNTLPSAVHAGACTGNAGARARGRVGVRVRGHAGARPLGEDQQRSFGDYLELAMQSQYNKRSV